MQPRCFLFWTVPRWLYDCVYSVAYTEILYADDVITQYNKKDKEKSDSERVEETMRIWEERKKKKGKNISLTNDVLNAQKQG